MPVLAFRHVAHEPLGRLATVLDERSIAWHFVDLWGAPPAVLPVDDAQALIIMGGPMSVNDPLPWLREEERCILRALSVGVPVLGICLGAQLLAKCLGARVYPMRRKEIGWHPVRLTEVGLSDPLLRDRAPGFLTFHWHGETFDLPAGARHLAASDLCTNQAFAVGSNIYGLQFHPEVEPPTIEHWCREDERCGSLREATEPVEPYANQQKMHKFAQEVFGRWCDSIVAPVIFPEPSNKLGGSW